MIPLLQGISGRTSSVCTARLLFTIILASLVSLVSLEKSRAQSDEPIVSPPSAEQPAAQPAESVGQDRILELSVNGNGRTAALVVWLLSNGDLKATQIEKKFSFEWLRIPDDAKAFIVTPDLGERKFDTNTFVDLGGLPGANVYVSLRMEASGTSFIRIDKDAAVQEPPPVKVETRLNPQEDGWVYIGSWDNDSSKWNTVYWLEHPATEVMSKRRRLSIAPPEGLIGKSAVLDFPLAYRKGPSTQFEQIQSGKFLSPGSKHQFQEVSRIPYPSHHEIWAKIKTNLPNRP